MKLKRFFTSKNKWVQGCSKNHRGQCCLTGALDQCYTNEDAKQAAMEKMVKYIKRYRHNTYGHDDNSHIYIVQAYNDDENRRFEDIKRLVTKLDI